MDHLMREGIMNTEHAQPIDNAAKSEPLFASPWVALFLVIRREFLAGRADR